MNHRRVILSLFVIAAVITGTAGYSSIQAERSVDVAVANEGDAFLAVEGQSPSIQNGTSEDAFEVTNQLGQPVDLTVQVLTAGGDVELGSVPEETIDGDGATADIDARCTGTQDGTLEITVRAESSDGDVMVQVDRSTMVTCT